ncbi:DUF1217 domain-containing protein [Hyphomicrobium nitrativorans]|nr:DUF1217 domain-containing protein [Hyphomicrobium nitrativorans]
MISTFISYRFYTADFSKSVRQTLADPMVKREQDYYRANIGNVTSIDDFLKDQRLYAYAMKAHGLEDMTYAKAFMRKVLESDLTDANSFVRKMVDPRYQAFARAFNFAPDGRVAEGVTIVQDSGDLEATVGLYSEQRLRKGSASMAEAEYYAARVATLTSVDQLVADPRLFAYALTAYDIDATIASEPFIRAVLTSDLGDPDSVANAIDDVRYQRLAAAFSFEADGSVAAGGAQTLEQLARTVELYYEETGASASPAAAAFRTTVFDTLAGGITNVDDFLAKPILRDYALVAVGLDPIYVSDAMVRDALTSDLGDPDSFANSSDSYRLLASLFNFNTSGELDPGVPMQTLEQRDLLVDGYFANYENKARASEDLHTSDYRFMIELMTSVDDVMRDQRVYTYIMRAFGLDASQESTTKIRQVLLSDPSDPFSYANQLRDSRYTALAGAFNFGPDGKPQGPLRAQLNSSVSETVALYTATLGEFDFQKEAGEAESKYYSETIDTIETVDQLLANSRLAAYVTRAFGMEGEQLSAQTLKQILTSDIDDPTSFVNLKPNTRFRAMAAAFNFDADGTAKRVVLGLAQDANAVRETQDLYIRQTMEQKAGSQNPGVRLALYFERKASSITSAYSILADKALLEVVMTALGLPDAIAQADVDMQAKLIANRLDFADFKDPEKIEKFISRFSALYDIKNPQQSPSIPSLLLGDTGIVGFGDDLLASIQAVQIRR